MKRILLMSSVLLLMFTACKKEILRGEGNISTQNRGLMIEQGFHAIRVNDATKVFIEAGTQKSLAVRGYDNLLNAYSTEVKNGVLTVGYKDNHNVRNDNVKVYITYPSVPNIDLNGSCEADFSGSFAFAEEVFATINGSGEINYDELDADIVRFNINGSGNINADKVLSSEAYIQMSGSGDIRVAVEDKLQANISGSGKVYYKGNPVIEMNISGSGKIIPLN